MNDSATARGAAQELAFEQPARRTGKPKPFGKPEEFLHRERLRGTRPKRGQCRAEYLDFRPKPPGVGRRGENRLRGERRAGQGYWILHLHVN